MSTPKYAVKQPVQRSTVKTPTPTEEQLLAQLSGERDSTIEQPDKMPLSNKSIVHLQRTIGNAALQRLLDDRPSITRSAGGESIQRLMATAKFIKKSRGPLWGAFTGKRDEIKKVEAALNNYHSGGSKSVSLTAVIKACDEYLQLAGRAGSRVTGVNALKLAATQELAAWRLRDREPLPKAVYRMDERTPEVIAKDGFQPWNPAGTVTIIEHVTQVLRNQKPDRPDGTSGEVGKGAKKHSQFVSTAGNLEFAKDPTLLAGLLNKYFYKIDTSINPNNFNDVSKSFDEMGEPNPYETQFEWAHEGGIAPACITQYFQGKDIQDMVIAGQINEGAIAWKDMPVLPPVPQPSGDIDGAPEIESESDTETESTTESETETH